jgi:hypothetical protein
VAPLRRLSANTGMGNLQATVRHPPSAAGCRHRTTDLDKRCSSLKTLAQATINCAGLAEQGPSCSSAVRRPPPLLRSADSRRGARGGTVTCYMVDDRLMPERSSGGGPAGGVRAPWWGLILSGRPDRLRVTHSPFEVNVAMLTNLSLRTTGEARMREPGGSSRGGSPERAGDRANWPYWGEGALCRPTACASVAAGTRAYFAADIVPPPKWTPLPSRQSSVLTGFIHPVCRSPTAGAEGSTPARAPAAAMLPGCRAPPNWADSAPDPIRCAGLPCS